MSAFLKKLAVPVFWIAVWWGISALVNRAVLVPSPAAVLGKLMELAGTGELYVSVLLSVLRILTGFLAAVLIGALFGALCAVFDLPDRFISPVMSVIRATPVASFIILALVLVNKEILPVFIAFLMVFPVIFGNVKTGVRNLDKKLLEMAAFFRLSWGKALRKVVFPQVSPYFFAGVKTCLGLAWKAGVAAEVLCFPIHSIGKNLYNAKVYLETDALFAWTILIIAISMLIERLVSGLIGIYEARHGDNGAPQGAQRSGNRSSGASAQTAVKRPASLRTPVRAAIKPERNRQPGASAQTAGKRPAPLRTPVRAAIKLENISKSYGDQVLENYSYTFEETGVYAITGPSGCGKTTLLRIMAGLDTEYEGKRSVPDAARFSMVFQENRLLSNLNVLDNVTLVCEDPDRAAELLTGLGLGNELNAKLSSLSGGMQRRVAIARALSADYDVLFMDEPFSSLDKERKSDIMDMLLSLSSEKLIILVTHDPLEAEYLHARVLRL